MQLRRGAIDQLAIGLSVSVQHDRNFAVGESFVIGSEGEGDARESAPPPGVRLGPVDRDLCEVDVVFHSNLSLGCISPAKVEAPAGASIRMHALAGQPFGEAV